MLHDTLSIAWRFSSSPLGSLPSVEQVYKVAQDSNNAISLELDENQTYVFFSSFLKKLEFGFETPSTPILGTKRVRELDTVL